MLSLVRQNISTDHVSQLAGSILPFGKASIMLSNICTFHRFYQFSNALAVSYVLSCVECQSCAPTVATKALVRMRYGNRTALVYH